MRPPPHPAPASSPQHARLASLAAGPVDRVAVEQQSCGLAYPDRKPLRTPSWQTSRHLYLSLAAGTVGLFLAVELGVKNVPFLLADAKETTSTHPKGSTVNARSMEHLRRLGVAAELRRIGVPSDHPTDIVYLTRFNGYELGRIEMPSTNEKVGNPGPWGPTLLTPEPIHRCNQFYLEPVLRRHAEMHPTSDLRFGWRNEQI